MPTFPEYVQAGGSNTFIPTYDGKATGNLIMEYSRNPKSFPLLRYSELRPVIPMRGFYLRIEPEQGARIVYPDGREFAWPPGADRPTGTDNQARFQFASYFCQRRAHSVRLDNRAIDPGVSAWDVAEVELREKAQQAMTQRTVFVSNLLLNANWGPNTNNATSLAGGKWNAGTVSTPYIQISLQAIEIAINLATLGVITPKDLVAVFNPNTATKISQSPEIKGMLSNSVYAYPQITGTLPGSQQRNWSLPPMLYDTRIAVEDTVRITSQRGAASVTRTYAIPDGAVFVLTRRENEMVNPAILKMETGENKMTQEELEAVPVNSTLVGFMKEEMTTENRTDTWNRKTDISIATDYDYQISQPLSGFYLSECGHLSAA